MRKGRGLAMSLMSWIKSKAAPKSEVYDEDLDCSAYRMSRDHQKQDDRALARYIDEHGFRLVRYIRPPLNEDFWFWRPEWDAPARFRLCNVHPSFNIAGLYWTKALNTGHRKESENG